MELIEAVEKNISGNKLLSKKERFILAVSGGPDSVCLLDIMTKLSRKYDWRFIVAHLNHGIRTESDFDEGFVKSLARKYGKKFESKKVKIIGSGTEEKAREARHKFFRELSKKYKTDKIVLAHHADDQIETVLLNLMRGAGTDGLSGMESKTEIGGLIIIRPMLGIFKKDIISYNKENKINFVSDKTNLDTKLRRNWTRNVLIPALEKENPNFKQKILGQTKEHQKRKEDIEKRIEEITKRKIRIKEDGFTSIPKNLFLGLNDEEVATLLRCLIKKVRGSTRDIYSSSLERLVNFVEKNRSGSKMPIVKGLIAYIDYDKIYFTRESFLKQSMLKKRKLNPSGTTEISETKKEIVANVFPERIKATEESNKAYIDYDKIGAKLGIRAVKDGDKIRPLGLKGTKKLQDLFVDLKVPFYLRKQIPVIIDGDKIVWIAGYRLSEDYKITKKTKNTLVLKLKDK